MATKPTPATPVAAAPAASAPTAPVATGLAASVPVAGTAEEGPDKMRTVFLLVMALLVGGLIGFFTSQVGKNPITQAANPVAQAPAQVAAPAPAPAASTPVVAAPAVTAPAGVVVNQSCNAESGTGQATKPVKVAEVQKPRKPNAAPAVAGAPDALLAKHGCKVLNQRGEILADFLDASNNPKRIVVTKAVQCLQERDEFVANGGWKTVSRESLKP